MINVITPQRAYNNKVCKYIVILIILITPLTFKFLVSESANKFGFVVLINPSNPKTNQIIEIIT